MTTNLFSGNKGEWSEPYVVLKLAADGLIFQADANMRPSASDFARVVKIIREDVTVNVAPNGDVEVESYDAAGLHHTYTVPVGGAETKAKKLLKCLLAIPQKKEGAFTLPEIDDELKYLGFSTLKNPVPKGQKTIKRDLSLVIENPNTGTAPTLGFSVKSELGSAPTLLNASGSTNIVYRLYGIDDKQMDAINQIETSTKIQDRCAQLKKSAAHIEFDHYQSSTFMNNLRLIDGDLPQMVADLVKVHYFDTKETVLDAVNGLSKSPRYADCAPIFCAVKIKRLLRACALGMTPSTPWPDFDDASGGYIIVLPDGELVAFYIYNRALLEKYLLENTKFEHPSTSKHGYATVYKENGKFFIKLNLQIRFTR